MSQDDIPKLADWLTEFRSRPPHVEVVVAVYDLDQRVPDEPVHGMAAGQVGVHVVRYDDPRKSADVNGVHYVMGVNADGSYTWDHWFESLADARQAIADGAYGAVRLREA